MEPTQIELLGTALFAIAVLHTFSVKAFHHFAYRYPEGSVGRNLFHLLGEVEIVFGFWAGVLITAMAILNGKQSAIEFVDKVDFTEPVFVFAIMTVASTTPVIDCAYSVIGAISRLIPMSREIAFYVTTLIIGPLLGSWITEPAAMAVTALLLRQRYYSRKVTNRFMYLSLGTLFVNVSIGGVLTPYAAPPILMVARTWDWDLGYTFTHFGWKAMLAVCVNTLICTALCWKDLTRLSPQKTERKQSKTPTWLQLTHLVALALIVLTAHHPKFFVGIFLFFLGITTITSELQEGLKLRQNLLVAFFLAGLVVLGSFQDWWLSQVIGSLNALSLFIGTTLLTGVTDNAALTFLGSQIPNLSEEAKYALVAGAVTGGGLTVIANAPNPAGFAILRDAFGPEGINPVRLFLSALVPTLITALFFWFLRAA